MKKKHWPIYLILGLIALWILAPNFYAEYKRSEFYKRGFNAKVISSSIIYSRITIFELENGLNIRSGVIKFNIEIGDSIVKSSNNWDFKVYKRSLNGSYEFYKLYDYDYSKSKYGKDN